MSPSPLRILIAENQYLIAMEVERMIAELVNCEVTITPLARMQQELAASAYDVVLLDAASSDTLNLQRVTAICATGAAPVFLSSYSDFAEEKSVIADYPSVTKPPLPEELAAAVLQAAGRNPSDGEGLLDHS